MGVAVPAGEIAKICAQPKLQTRLVTREGSPSFACGNWQDALRKIGLFQLSLAEGSGRGKDPRSSKDASHSFCRAYMLGS